MSEYVRRYADLRHFLMGHLRSCAEQMGKLQLPQKPEVEDSHLLIGTSALIPPRREGKRRRLHGPFAEAAYQQGRSHEELFERMLALLKEAPEPPGKEDEERLLLARASGEFETFNGSFLPALKTTPQEAWLKLLGLRVPLAHCAGLLQLLPSQVIPHLGRPLLVSDFYLRAFNAGSLELSVQALSGLLLLLTRYGLGDPETLSSSCGDFYAQLYSLLRPATFRLKKRARFQRLVAAALTSNLLPATSAAAFAKRQGSACAVRYYCQSPVMWLLSVAYGLIQRNHSRCSFLLHRAGDAVAKDPFDSEARCSSNECTRARACATMGRMG
ncbi:unnamed protein product [Effrenium voratum]|nr:unnamed protein product [Effrenium voratum]